MQAADGVSLLCSKTAAAELSTPPLIPKNTCAIEASYASMHIPDRIMSNRYAKWY